MKVRSPDTLQRPPLCLSQLLGDVISVFGGTSGYIETRERRKCDRTKPGCVAPCSSGFEVRSSASLLYTSFVWLMRRVLPAMARLTAYFRLSHLDIDRPAVMRARSSNGRLLRWAQETFLRATSDILCSHSSRLFVVQPIDVRLIAHLAHPLSLRRSIALVILVNIP